jgi:hypothetical protein
MAITHNVKLVVTPQYQVLQTESEGGLKYAVVYNGTKIIALFGSDYWASEFIKSADMNAFELREVAE